MESKKKWLAGIGFLAMAAFMLVSTTALMVSCSPTSIPTNPATPTHTPLPPTNTQTFTPTGTLTPINTTTPVVGATLAAGSIAFTGLTYNGDSQISFVATNNISSGTTIYFTNYSYDATLNALVDESTTSATASSNWTGTPSGNIVWESATYATTITEGTISYVTGPAGLSAYSQVVIGNTGDEANILQGGTVNNVAGASGDTWLVENHNGGGHKVLCWTGPGITVGASLPGGVTWLAAIIFGPDSWTSAGPIGQLCFWDSYLPPGLTSGANAIDLSGLWANSQDGNLGAYNSAAGGQNDNAVLNSCQNTLAGICTASNWAADANEPKGSVNMSGPIGMQACSSSAAGYTGLIN
jgi:hypothetical protein